MYTFPIGQLMMRTFEALLPVKRVFFAVFMERANSFLLGRIFRAIEEPCSGFRSEKHVWKSIYLFSSVVKCLMLPVALLKHLIYGQTKLISSGQITSSKIPPYCILLIVACFGNLHLTASRRKKRICFPFKTYLYQIEVMITG